MRVETATGRVLDGPLEAVYVYEAPVRLWHWVMALCMVVLAGTGYLIGSPLPAIGGEAVHSYFFAWIRISQTSIGVCVRAGPLAVSNCPAITRTVPAPAGSAATGIAGLTMS